jgi:hypothetical protein
MRKLAAGYILAGSHAHPEKIRMLPDNEYHDNQGMMSGKHGENVMARLSANNIVQVTKTDDSGEKTESPRDLSTEELIGAPSTGRQEKIDSIQPLPIADYNIAHDRSAAS